MATDLFQKTYDTDWTRKDQLQSAIAAPIGLLVVFSGALVFLVRETFSSSGAAPLRLPWLVYASLFGAAIAFIWGAYAVARSTVGYLYQVVPYADELADYRRSLRSWHTSHGGTTDIADREFDDWLNERYAEASAINARNNADRGSWIYWAYIAIVWIGIATTLATVPVALTLRDRKARPAQLQIGNVTSQSENRMADDNSNQAQPQSSTDAKPVESKPTPPVNHNVRTANREIEKKTPRDSSGEKK